MPWGFETCAAEWTTDDFGTPPDLCALVALALAGIDLDPFSNRWAVVPAKRCFRLDRGDDARVLPWVMPWAAGRRTTVYANGGYSEPEWWLDRCATLCELGHCEVIACVRVDVTTRWWLEHVWERATAIAWMRHRVRFLEEGRPAKNTAQFSVALPYYGHRPRRFRWVFEHPNAAKVTVL
jgi:hypothetical protein